LKRESVVQMRLGLKLPVEIAVAVPEAAFCCFLKVPLTERPLQVFAGTISARTA
jgi:hypothetical protein